MNQTTERQISFLRRGGHTHNGIDSSPIQMPAHSVTLDMLDQGVINFIQNMAGTVINNGGSSVAPVVDIQFTTASLGPGQIETGTLSWVNVSLVRFTQVLMTTSSQCVLNFYHNSTFADEDREFRAENCVDGFLWEGPWVHFDEFASHNLYYKVENTGTATTAFKVTLKACGVS